MTKRLEAMGIDKYKNLVNEGKSHFNGVVRCHEDALTIPLKWKTPRMCFVNSMSDLFHKDVPFEFIDRVFAVMALTPHITYQVLTKRPERMAEYLNENDGLSTPLRIEHQLHLLRGKPPGECWCVDGSRYPLPNVWLGTSVENQRAADLRIPHLLKCPAAVRFLSCEPLIGDVELTGRTLGGDRLPYINWVIVGGESGPNRRVMDLVWLMSIVDQCKVAGVPVFVKQDSGPRAGMKGRIPDEYWIKEFPKEPGE